VTGVGTVTGVIGVTGVVIIPGVIGVTGVVTVTGVIGVTGVVAIPGVIGVTGVVAIPGVIGVTGVVTGPGVTGVTGVVTGPGVIGVTGMVVTGAGVTGTGTGAGVGGAAVTGTTCTARGFITPRIASGVSNTPAGVMFVSGAAAAALIKLCCAACVSGTMIIITNILAIRFIAGRPCVSYSCTICVCAHAAYQVHKYTIFPIKTFAHLCYNVNMYFEHYIGHLSRGPHRAAARGVCPQQRWLLVAVLACSTAILCLGDAPMKPMTIRQPAVAGSWYPADKSALAREINGYLQQAARTLTGVTIRALIAPHAGYAYAGRCAAESFKQLEGQSVARVFLLGPSHHIAFEGIATLNVDAFETPLGLVPLDRTVLDALRKNPLVRDLPAAHAREHALELELPFLQTMLKEFTLVPLIVGQLTPSQAAELGALLKQHVGPRDVVVVSTDFTHYGAAFDFAPFRDDVKNRLSALDQGAFDRILAKDTKGIFTYAAQTGITWDGVMPTVLMLAALPPAAHGTLLRYYKSGDADNEYTHSVSYAALAFYDAVAAPPAPSLPLSTSPPLPLSTTPSLNTAAPAVAATNETGLTEAERQTLLTLARATLTRHVQNKGVPDLAAYSLTPRLKEKAGAFVTLHEHGELRGCIGYIEGIKPLAETVRENACNAATEDPRFPPVRPAELGTIKIEISVMSPLRKVAAPTDVIAGVHGVVLKKGRYQGVFLPQVATEQGWDRETFLRQLGRKAGLDLDAYQSAELFVFTAEVFGEHTP